MSPYPERLADHWWWRPGVGPDSRLLVWHILFADQPQVRELAAEYQRRLEGIPGLDPVPAEWLHMTTYIAGMAEEIGEDAVEEMVAAVANRLDRLAPVRVSLGDLLFHTEAVVLGVRPGDALDPLHEAVVAGVAETIGGGHVSNEPAFVPHMSIAYSNTDGPAEPVIRALTPAPEPCTVTISEVRLVVQQRVHHLYRWDPIASARLGG